MGKPLVHRRDLTQARVVGASAWDLGWQDFDLVSRHHSQLKQPVGPNERVQLDMCLSSSWHAEPVLTDRSDSRWILSSWIGRSESSPLHGTQIRFWTYSTSLSRSICMLLLTVHESLRVLQRLHGGPQSLMTFDLADTSQCLLVAT